MTGRTLSATAVPLHDRADAIVSGGGATLSVQFVSQPFLKNLAGGNLFQMLPRVRKHIAHPLGCTPGGYEEVPAQLRVSSTYSFASTLVMSLDAYENARAACGTTSECGHG